MASYFVCSLAAGTNVGTSWVDACVSVPALMTAQALVASDIIYVHNLHNYVAGVAITWNLPETGPGLLPTHVYCVDGGDAAFTALGAAMGTTVGSLTTGGKENTNGNSTFNLNCDVYVHGITFQAGAGGASSGADIAVGNGAANISLVFQACTFYINSTSSSAEVMVSGSGFTNKTIIFKDCTFQFGAVGQHIVPNGGQTIFYNCTISASGSAPTTLFIQGSARANVIRCFGCDWSRSTNVLSQTGSTMGDFYFNNCTIGTPTTATNTSITSEFHACAAVDGTNGANILAYYAETHLGVVQDDQTVYVTSSPGQGTQDDGTATSYSLKITPSAQVTPSRPLYTPWRARKIAATGSKTLTVKVADTEGALLKDRELFLEIEYMGGAAPANSPQSAVEGTWPLVGVYADFTTAGSNLTDTGEAWVGIAETGTYTLSKTVTLDEQGYVRWRVGLGKDTTNPIYVDGKLGVA